MLVDLSDPSTVEKRVERKVLMMADKMVGRRDEKKVALKDAWKVEMKVD